MVDPPLLSPSSAMSPDGSDPDEALSRSQSLTREEVIRRRCRRVKKLAKLYREHYWALMEELRSKHREYYWVYGKSPYKEYEHEGGGEREQEKQANGIGIGKGSDVVNRCVVRGCKGKAMALTRFCHTHILSDQEQKLYRGCEYVIRRISAPTGPLLCGKPILISTVPPLCPRHSQKPEKRATQTLKNAGLNASSSSKLGPKCHVIVAEFVREIQTKRRASQKATKKLEIKEENEY